MADLKDRVAVYPRRIKITPEGGGTPYYATWDFADYPTEAGTLLDKDTLLSGAAATAVGLSAGATLPSDAFIKLAGDISGKAPLDHASRHASGAADAIAPSDIGAESSTLTSSTKTDNYTILASDNRSKISMNSSSDKTFTFATQAVGNYPDGMIVFLKRLGTGAVTIAGSAGVTLQSAGNRLKIAEQYAWVFVRKIATDGWEVVGSTSL